MAKIVDQGTSSRGRGRFARWLRLLTREPVQGEVGKMAMVVNQGTSSRGDWQDGYGC